MHPSQLSDLLLQHYPELEYADQHQLHAYASLMLRLATHGYRRHKHAGKGNLPDTAQSLHCRTLSKIFGKAGFTHLNAITGCVGQTSNWSAQHNETRGYWLSDTGRNLIESARMHALNGRKNVLLDSKGKLVRRRRNGIFTARDSSNRRAATDAFIHWAVPVNLTAIEHALNTGLSNVLPDAKAARLERADGELRAIHATALNESPGFGMLPQEYKESDAGRLYGFGGLSLQNVTREAKTIALCGGHEYDFSNCHFRILIQAAMMVGTHTPVMQRYVDAPGQFRRSLARDLGITAKQVKKCLLAMLYGAKRSAWNACAIPEMIGTAKAGLLYVHPQFDELAQEVAQAGSVLRDNAPRLPNGAVVNCRGKTCSGSTDQKTAHILQGLEANMLHAALEEYGEYVLLLQHDGFTLSKHIEPAAIEAAISYATGFEMPVTYEQLTLPGLEPKIH